MAGRRGCAHGWDETRGGSSSCFLGQRRGSADGWHVALTAPGVCGAPTCLTLTATEAMRRNASESPEAASDSLPSRRSLCSGPTELDAPGKERFSPRRPVCCVLSRHPETPQNSPRTRRLLFSQCTGVRTYLASKLQMTCRLLHLVSTLSCRPWLHFPLVLGEICSYLPNDALCELGQVTSPRRSQPPHLQDKGIV